MLIQLLCIRTSNDSQFNQIRLPALKVPDSAPIIRCGEIFLPLALALLVQLREQGPGKCIVAGHRVKHLAKLPTRCGHDVFHLLLKRLLVIKDSSVEVTDNVSGCSRTGSKGFEATGYSNLDGKLANAARATENNNPLVLLLGQIIHARHLDPQPIEEAEAGRLCAHTHGSRLLDGDVLGLGNRDVCVHQEELLCRVVATRAKACATADFVADFEFAACLFTDFDDDTSGVDAEADREAIREEEACATDERISGLMLVDD